MVFASNLEEVINRRVRGRVVHLFGLSTSHVLKMEAKRDIDGLIKALAYKKDPVVRKWAAKALGEIGDACAVDGLVSALKDQDKVVRRFVVVALGIIGGASAVEGLVAALKDHDKWVRAWAASALEKIRQKELGLPHAV